MPNDATDTIATDTIATDTIATDTIALHFTLDGSPVEMTVPPKRSVLSLLREELGRTEMKAGCSPQGICGCCVVLVGNKPRVSCTLPCKTLQGKEVVTMAAIPAEEAALYSAAFAEAGGSQCGYCTPGIVLQTKALLDKNPTPDSGAINKALNMHICRCTGWSKIHDSIERAAAMRRGEPVEPVRPMTGALPELDLRAQICGVKPYVDDMSRPGMLHAQVAWSDEQVNQVDDTAALQIEGVHTVLSGPSLGRGVAAIVAAQTLEAARAGVAALVVETTPHAAGTQTQIERRLQDGDSAGALDGCVHVVETQCTTAPVEPAFLEPDACLAIPQAGGLVIYTNLDGLGVQQTAVCEALDLKPEAVVIHHVPAGGAFGGKRDTTTCVLAARLAQETSRPVRLSLTMDEAIQSHAKQAGTRQQIRLGCDASGNLVALEAQITLEMGRQDDDGILVHAVEQALRHVTGPYRIPYLDIVVSAETGPGPAGGAGRAAGASAMGFALETAMGQLAEQVASNPLDFRLANIGAHPDPHLRAAATACLEALRPHLDQAQAADQHTGLACAVLQADFGTQDGRAILEVVGPHAVRLLIGQPESGQGLHNTLVHLAAGASGLPPHCFQVRCSTESGTIGPSAPGVGEFLLGNAVRAAASGLYRARQANESDDLSALVGQRFVGTAQPPPIGALGFAAQLAIISAEGTLQSLVASADVGHHPDPVACEGQVEGGLHMGLGTALSEGLNVEPDGSWEGRFAKLGIIKSRRMPELKTILVTQAHPHAPWASNAAPALSMTPTPAAVAAALAAHDGVWRTSIPMKANPAARAMGIRPPRPKKK